MQHVFVLALETHTHTHTHTNTLKDGRLLGNMNDATSECEMEMFGIENHDVYACVVKLNVFN